MPNDERTVFLSYAREDIGAATRLYQSLTSAGITVWFDKESLRPGIKWKPTINAAIRDCRYFIALLSSRSVSKRGFVQSEIKQALDVLDQYPENETYVIPLRLDVCQVTHEKLNDLNWVDLFPEWQDGEDKLLRFFGIEREAKRLTMDESSTITRQSLAPTVRVDGLYQSKKSGEGSEGYWHYLRFYPDGAVIAASVSGTAQEIIEWFTKEWSVGVWKAENQFMISGNRITFSHKTMYGTVDYEGEIHGDRLILRWHSHINDNRGVGEYEFVAFEV